MFPSYRYLRCYEVPGRGPAVGSEAFSSAKTTAWPRSRRPSFASTAVTWVFTDYAPANARPLRSGIPYRPHAGPDRVHLAAAQYSLGEDTQIQVGARTLPRLLRATTSRPPASDAGPGTWRSFDST